MRRQIYPTGQSEQTYGGQSQHQQQKSSISVTPCTQYHPLPVGHVQQTSLEQVEYREPQPLRHQQLQSRVDATPRAQYSPHPVGHDTQTSLEHDDHDDHDEHVEHVEHLEYGEEPENTRSAGPLIPSPDDPRTGPNGYAEEMRQLAGGPILSSFDFPQPASVLTSTISQDEQKAILKRAQIANVTGIKTTEAESCMLRYQLAKRQNAQRADESSNRGREADDASSSLRESMSTLQIHRVQIPEFVVRPSPWDLISGTAKLGV